MINYDYLFDLIDRLRDTRLGSQAAEVLLQCIELELSKGEL